MWWSLRSPLKRIVCQCSVAGPYGFESALAWRKLMSPDKSVAAKASPDSVKSQLRLIRPAMTALFLDPDVSSAERLANTLRAQHRVVVVGSANEALAQVDSRVPDLI